MKTIKIRGKYQYKLEKSRLERNDEVIIEAGKYQAKDVKEGFTHFIKIESKK